MGFEPTEGEKQALFVVKKFCEETHAELHYDGEGRPVVELTYCPDYNEHRTITYRWEPEGHFGIAVFGPTGMITCRTGIKCTYEELAELVADAIKNMDDVLSDG